MNILEIDLPELTPASVEKTNRAIATFSNRVYSAGEIDFYLRATELPTGSTAQLNCLVFGQEIELYVSLACINTLLAPFALRLEDMSEDAIALFLLSHVQNMPKNIQVLSMCIKKQDFYPYDCAFELVSYTTGASLGWYISALVGDKLPLQEMAQAFSPYLKGIMSPHLASLPIALPLVASTLELPSDQIDTLCVGDVLLLGGV